VNERGGFEQDAAITYLLKVVWQLGGGDNSLVRRKMELKISKGKFCGQEVTLTVVQL
jgi:hypothetical protein